MKKVPYTKIAKSLDEQITILRGRNVMISDEIKTKEQLLDIGYYRLGFYSFPFEVTFPELGHRRSHKLKNGTKIEDIVALYYYDCDLRSILNKYLSRIEVSIRTTIIYNLSLKYKGNNNWFVDPNIVSNSFISKFDFEVYNYLRNKEPIVRHHKKYFGKYAPAWKTIEFMTLGNLENLYDNLILDSDKRLISTQYGEPAISVFKSYLSAIREVRNACAHGNVIYGLKLSHGIKTGKASASFIPGTSQNFNGALRVIDYMVRRISTNRANQMQEELVNATRTLYSKVPILRPMIELNTGIIVPK